MAWEIEHALGARFGDYYRITMEAGDHVIVSAKVPGEPRSTTSKPTWSDPPSSTGPRMQPAATSRSG